MVSVGSDQRAFLWKVPAASGARVERAALPSARSVPPSCFSLGRHERLVRCSSVDWIAASQITHALVVPAAASTLLKLRQTLKDDDNDDDDDDDDDDERRKGSGRVFFDGCGA